MVLIAYRFIDRTKKLTPNLKTYSSLPPPRHQGKLETTVN
jgi:hypothetical protein